MFETLYCRQALCSRHRRGPLAAERERYLNHCASQGETWACLRLRARSILLVAERMSTADVGHVDAVRLDELVTSHMAFGQAKARLLSSHTRAWLKFLGWWRASREPIAFERELDNFVSWMRDERGLTPCTVNQWRDRTATFLRWCRDTGRDLSTLRPEDIDAYFITYGGQRWSRKSARYMAQMLRVFLRHAATIGECSAALADSIHVPRGYTLESLPYALSWGDVRRLIATTGSDSESDIRNRAILLLLAVYGLRCGEVATLRLDQIDRAAGQLHILRLKRRQPQIYPLVPTVGEALARYVDEVRPSVAHAEVFIRTKAPRVPIRPSSLYDIVSRRLRPSTSRPPTLGRTV